MEVTDTLKPLSCKTEIHYGVLISIKPNLGPSTTVHLDKTAKLSSLVWLTSVFVTFPPYSTKKILKNLSSKVKFNILLTENVRLVKCSRQLNIKKKKTVGRRRSRN